VKEASPTSYSTVGETITYSYTITNTGNTTLTGTFSVSDDKVTVTCPAGGLAPNASMNCSGSYAITQADLDNGSLTNVAQAHSNNTDSNTDTETVTAAQSPSISLTKSASPVVYSAAGQVITYTYTITNTGNVTLVGPFSVTDDKLGTFTCLTSLTSLAPSGSGTCTRTYTITASNMTIPSITNTATATVLYHGQPVTSNQATATIYRQTAQILPTATTCQNYRAGATSLGFLDYQISKNKIGSVAPGVLFYYNTITVTELPYTVTVSQSHTSVSPDWPVIPVQDIGQVILWDYNTCLKSSAQGTVSFNATTGAVTFAVNQTGSYIISIKYNPGALAGTSVQKSAGQYPTVTYTFSDGTPPGAAGITIRPKK